MKQLLSLFLLLFVAFPAPLSAQDKKPDVKPAVKIDFSKKGRGYVPLTPARRAFLHQQSVMRHGRRLEKLAKFQDLPSGFNASDKGWVIPVGDQGNCGSCYLYSTSYGTMSQAFVKAGYGKNDGSFVMSPQFGLDCQNFGGCGGGNGSEVIDWAMKNGWPAETYVDINGTVHNDYPKYTATESSCRKVTGAKLWKVANWGFVAADPNRPATTLEIKTALYNFGALNVSLDAGGQFDNGTATITALGTSIDHEIELTAYDDTKDGGAFLLKNQWSKNWGVGGFRWVTYQAAQNLVDVFFATATPLPPPPAPPTPVPPVPPVPPGPVPAGIDVLNITGPSVTGGSITRELVPVGVTAAGQQLGSLLTPAAPVPPPVLPIEARMDRVEKNVAEILSILKVPTSKEPPLGDMPTRAEYNAMMEQQRQMMTIIIGLQKQLLPSKGAK